MSHDNISTLNDQAFGLLDRGDRQGAKILFEQALLANSRNSEAMVMLGTIHAEQGDLIGAERYLRQALVLDPEYADAFYYLGSVLQAQGKMAAALTCVERAVTLDPEFVDAQKLLINLQQLLGKSISAQNGNQPVQMLSGATQAAFHEASVLLQQGKFEQAASCYIAVTQQQPELAVAWFFLARTRGQQGQHTEAERCCREAIRLDEGLVAAYMMLASFLLAQGKIEEASNQSDMAIQLAPTDINAIALAANIAKHLNNPERAYELLSPLLKGEVVNVNVALAFSMISKDLNRQQEAIDLMEKVLNFDSSLSMTGKSNLHFNLGMLYDNISQYNNAFSHYQQGNKLKPVSFDQKQYSLSIEKHINTHSSELMACLPRASFSSQRPIFIVGMVRSGTSLVEQILSSHPDVYGAGELGDIFQISKSLPGMIGTNVPYPECLTQLTQSQADSLAQRYLDRLEQISPNAKRVTDKLPGNFMHLGLIESLFPDARVIHCMRDPVDTCLSVYFQDFSTLHPYAYDLSNIGAFYQGYLKLMEHWRKVLRLPLLEISYEDLISDQERVSRAMVEFCGLEWNDSCLQFHKNKRFVRTASHDQVNRPIYQQSVARWKNYETHLAPLLAALKLKE